MEKYHLQVELDVWAENLPKALKEFAKRLTEATAVAADLPLEALKDLGPEASGMVLGGPPTETERGWKCLVSISKPGD
jgi:hypothetical protein